MQRKKFIKNALLITAATAVFPPKLFAITNANTDGKEDKFPVFSTPDLVKNRKDGIIDLHCHPSMKMYLEGKKIWKRHWFRSPGASLFHMQIDVHGLATGNVAGMLASHYLVEGAVKEKWTRLKKLFPVLKFVWLSEADKVEHEDYSNFTQISIMIDDLESQVHIANDKLKQRKKNMRIVIAQNWEEFRRALDSDDTIPMAHAIEGAHALGRNFPISAEKKASNLENAFKMEVNKHNLDKIPTDSTYYIRNLKMLKARGVCLMTLSHFFHNDIADPVEGVSPDEKKVPKMDWSYNLTLNFPLSKVGTDVVNAMFDIGMVVDITHTTPQVRRDVFKINKDRAAAGKQLRPVVFTHVGSQYVFEAHDNNQFPLYKYYDVDKTDIDDIVACNGMIGVIPENFWLAGGDTHLGKYGLEAKDFRYGIDFMIETMIDLKTRMNGSVDYIGIGTDFDGLADNPKDLYLNTQLNDLMTAMRKKKDDTGKRIFEDADITKIASGNARRVLELGWTNEALTI